ncbi:MAG: hypothetical protein JJ858_07485 [Rhizobiaceae bacterium]|nr:hypothetical protein [Rhizobiaceae bacterium]
MSYCFRDLETAGEDQRKSAILLALVASLDHLRKPNPAESRKFGELFIPLFNAAPIETQRRASSSLSRCPFVPANVCEFLSLQPLEISAPFLSHSPSLTNAILCYIIAKSDTEHARIIAKRQELNKRVVQCLLALNEDSVNRALQLRGYVGDAAIHMDEDSITRFDISHKVIGEIDGSAENYGRVEFFGDIEFQSEADDHEWIEIEDNLRPGHVEFFVDMDTKTVSNEEQWIEIEDNLRPGHVEFFDDRYTQTAQEEWVELGNTFSAGGIEAFNNMELQNAKDGLDAIDDHQFAAEEHLRQTLRELAQGDLTPEQATILAKQTEQQTYEGEFEAHNVTLPIHSGEIAHRKYISVMAKHVANNHVEYFTTALADAIGSSVELAERIMDDMSGYQLAVTFNAILAPQELCVDALNKFFPHVSIMEGTKEGADHLLENMQHGTCLNRLITWLRADIITREHHMVDLDLSEANVDYAQITAADLPYITPIADNNDETPLWTEEQQMDGKDANWLQAIGD